MSWHDLQDWLFSFGRQYGVNPLIFALLYFGTIPISIVSFTCLYKNARNGKAIFLPALFAFLSFTGTYIYLFFVGKNIPLWVWGIIGLFLLFGGWQFYLKMRKSINAPSISQK